MQCVLMHKRTAVAEIESLSDQYWINPKGSNLTWDNVIFFKTIF